MQHTTYTIIITMLACACSAEKVIRRTPWNGSLEGTKVDAESNQDDATEISNDFSPEELAKLRELYKSGVALYNSTCVSCHGPLATSTKRNQSAKHITNAISKIPNMKFLENLTAEQIEAVATALSDDLKKVIGETQKSEGEPPGMLLQVFATRTFLASQLEAVFIGKADASAAAAAKTLIQANITDQFAVFGGPCTPYDGCVSTKPPDRLAKQLAPMQPNATSSRSGYRIQVCDKILESDGSIRNVLSNAKVSENETANIESINKLYKLFVPGHQPSSELSAALQAIYNEAQTQNFTAISRWRFIILPLCTSTAMELF